MKLTSAKLKQLILETMNEQLLSEDAKGPNDLPPEVYVRVTSEDYSDNYVRVMLTDKEGEELFPENSPIWGAVGFWKQDPFGQPCDGAAVIASTGASHGWGPFLYDLAIETATITSNGLTPDRGYVSEDAQAVWDFYLRNRSNSRGGDVMVHQLGDDCGQYAATQRAEERGGKWNDKDNPLSKRFTKPPTIKNQLGDKLIWEL